MKNTLIMYISPQPMWEELKGVLYLCLVYSEGRSGPTSALRAQVGQNLEDYMWKIR